MGAVKPAVPQPEPIPPMSLDELHKIVQRRINWLLYFRHSEDGYIPLADRARDAKAGRLSHNPAADLAALQADLTELLDAPDDTLRRMAMNQATSARCHNPHSERVMASHYALIAQQQQRDLTRPRVTPAELVQSFAARGVTITAVDGNLHVTPGDRLTDADREVLRAYKPAVLAVLEQPAAVI